MLPWFKKNNNKYLKLFFYSLFQVCKMFLMVLVIYNYPGTNNINVVFFMIFQEEKF